MRRILFSLLICLLCVNVIGCADEADLKIHEPIKFYYRNAAISYNSNVGVISAEIREAAEHQQDYEYLINTYLQGPTGVLHHDTFPAETTLRKFEIDNNTVKITLSKEFSELSGHELYIACAALTETLLEMTAATTVVICLSEGKLGTASELTFTADDLMFLDDNYSFVASG